MARLIIVGLLNVIEMGMPITYHALLAIVYLSNRNSVLLELFQARQALAELEAELKQISDLDADAVRSRFEDGLHLEILACKSQIRRLRKEVNRIGCEFESERVLHEYLLCAIQSDREDLHHFESLAEQLSTLDSSQLREAYITSLRERIAAQELTCKQLEELIDASNDSDEDSTSDDSPYMRFGLEQCA